MRKLTTPLTEEDVKSLHAGDHVLLSGVVYTARDAAHLRMMDLIRAGKPLPVDLAGQVIYYAGPTPTPPGQRPLTEAERQDVNRDIEAANRKVREARK